MIETVGLSCRASLTSEISGSGPRRVVECADHRSHRSSRAGSRVRAGTHQGSEQSECLHPGPSHVSLSSSQDASLHLPALVLGQPGGQIADPPWARLLAHICSLTVEFDWIAGVSVFQGRPRRARVIAPGCSSCSRLCCERESTGCSQIRDHNRQYWPLINYLT